MRTITPEPDLDFLEYVESIEEMWGLQADHHSSFSNRVRRIEDYVHGPNNGEMAHSMCERLDLLRFYNKSDNITWADEIGKWEMALLGYSSENVLMKRFEEIEMAMKGVKQTGNIYERFCNLFTRSRMLH